MWLEHSGVMNVLTLMKSKNKKGLLERPGFLIS